MRSHKKISLASFGHYPTIFRGSTRCIGTFVSGQGTLDNQPIPLKSLLAGRTLGDIYSKGYAYIPSNYFFKQVPHTPLEEVLRTYDDLKPDPSPGNRFRAYIRFRWDESRDQLVQDDNNDYYQSKEYNEADGGKIRQFDAIPPRFLNNPIIKETIKGDTEIAKAISVVTFSETLEVGLHQIRYRALPQSPAYSSPIWLHRDDEPLVFVHLLHLSPHAIGGDNLISVSKGNTVNDVLKLTSPLQSLALTQKPLHALTPLGTKSNNPALRDILLVTFFNNPKRAKKTGEIEEKANYKNDVPGKNNAPMERSLG